MTASAEAFPSAGLIAEWRAYSWQEPKRSAEQALVSTPFVLGRQSVSFLHVCSALFLSVIAMLWPRLDSSCASRNSRASFTISGVPAPIESGRSSEQEDRTCS
jgi:hypothetical protein